MGHRVCFFVSALAPEPGAKQSPQASQPGGCDPRQHSEGKGAKCQRKQHNIASPRGNLVGSLEGIWECSSSVSVAFYRLLTMSKCFRKWRITSVSYSSHSLLNTSCFVWSGNSSWNIDTAWLILSSRSKPAQLLEAEAGFSACTKGLLRNSVWTCLCWAFTVHLCMAEVSTVTDLFVNTLCHICSFGI